jgi:hypothetical protein
LPVQGDCTYIGDVNNGNFVSILEPLGRYGKITGENLVKVQISYLEDEKRKEKQ